MCGSLLWLIFIQNSLSAVSLHRLTVYIINSFDILSSMSNASQKFPSHLHVDVCIIFMTWPIIAMKLEIKCVPSNTKYLILLSEPIF